MGNRRSSVRTRLFLKTRLFLPVLGVAALSVALSACPKKSDTAPKGGTTPTARPSKPRPPRARPFKPTWDVLTFKAGHVRVIHKQTPGKPVTALRLYYQGGCQNLTDQNAGIEEMVLAATEEAGSANFPIDKLPAELYSRGIQLHAAAGQDYSVLGIKCVKQHFPKAWKILTDLALRPNLSGEGLKIQRRRQLKAIKTRRDSPGQHISLAIEKFFFAGHPYERLQIGTETNVKRFTPNDLKAYHKKLLKADRLLLVVVGDLDREDLKRRAVAAFGKVAASETPFKPRKAPVLPRSRLKVVPRDLGPVHFVIGYFTAPTPGHPDYAPLRVGLSILSDTLFREIRTKRPLVYAVSSGLSVRRGNVGYLYLSTRKPNLAVRVSVREMRKIINQGVTQEQLNDKLQVFLTTYLMKIQTQSAQAKLLARAELLTGNWQWAERHLEEIRQVTAPQIQRAMKKYCRNLQFVVLGASSVDKAVFTSL